MSIYMMVSLIGALLAFIGFHMAFRHVSVRRLLRRPARPRSLGEDEDEDPLACALRIAGVMLMAFSVVIGTMFTMVHFGASLYTPTG